MKASPFIFILVFLLLYLSSTGMAQGSTAGTSATIVTTIAFAKVTDMRVLKIPKSASVDQIITQIGAEFVIGQTDNNYLSITIRSPIVSLKGSLGYITVINLKDAYKTEYLTSNAFKTFKVKGDLSVAQGTIPGVYSNSTDFVVTLHYN